MRKLKKTLVVLFCIAGSLPLTPASAGVVTDWNAITLRCSQGGPTPPNRAGPPGLLDIALVQAAVHDAIQAIEGRFEPYHYDNLERRGSGSAAAAGIARRD